MALKHFDQRASMDGYGRFYTDSPSIYNNERLNLLQRQWECMYTRI